MLPQDKVQYLINRHLELEKELSSGQVNKKKFAEISKEYSDLNDIIKYAKEYLSYKKDTDDLNTIIIDKYSDSEMKEFANNELENLKVNDLVGFTPNSEFEFIIDNERLYRVLTKAITIKYEYQGKEKEYNPSWL